jgi:glycosyltransferase involved in cell wall biosynthesis
MKIAIVSTRGIPNNYGGFEQFAEFISVELVKRGHCITVYNPHFHPYQKEKFNGVDVIKIFSPEKQIKTAANFIYDYLSLKHAIKSKHDIILCCGYTTSSVFFPLINFEKTKLVTNVDGIEWKRSKYSRLIQRLTKWFEKLAINYSDALIADNVGIANYIKESYNKTSAFIPYGANSNPEFDSEILKNYFVDAHEYDVLMARMEPENNIEMILTAYAETPSQKILVVGSTKNNFGKKMRNKFSSFSNILFVEWIGDKITLDTLRHFSRLYIHGHSVGGTNPSLLEAMAAKSLIVAHNNAFNKGVLGEDAVYFDSIDELKSIIEQKEFSKKEIFKSQNKYKISEHYNWNRITDDYENLFNSLVRKKV